MTFPFLFISTLPHFHASPSTEWKSIFRRFRGAERWALEASRGAGHQLPPRHRAPPAARRPPGGDTIGDSGIAEALGTARKGVDVDLTPTGLDL